MIQLPINNHCKTDNVSTKNPHAPVQVTIAIKNWQRDILRDISAKQGYETITAFVRDLLEAIIEQEKAND